MTGTNLQQLDDVVLELELSDHECKVLYRNLLSILATRVDGSTWTWAVLEARTSVAPSSRL